LTAPHQEHAFAVVSIQARLGGAVGRKAVISRAGSLSVDGLIEVAWREGTQDCWAYYLADLRVSKRSTAPLAGEAAQAMFTVAAPELPEDPALQAFAEAALPASLLNAHARPMAGRDDPTRQRQERTLALARDVLAAHARHLASLQCMADLQGGSAADALRNLERALVKLRALVTPAAWGQPGGPDAVAAAIVELEETATEMRRAADGQAEVAEHGPLYALLRGRAGTAPLTVAPLVPRELRTALAFLQVALGAVTPRMRIVELAMSLAGPSTAALSHEAFAQRVVAAADAHQLPLTQRHWLARVGQELQQGQDVMRHAAVAITRWREARETWTEAVAVVAAAESAPAVRRVALLASIEAGRLRACAVPLTHLSATFGPFPALAGLFPAMARH
jgi:hypothetical protein